MPTFSGGYVEPGVYIKIEDAVLPSLPAGVLAAGIVGIGKAEKTITNETVEFQLSTLSLYSTAALETSTIDILSTGMNVTDSTGGITYIQGTDFTLDTALPDKNKIFWLGNPPTTVTTSGILADYTAVVTAEGRSYNSATADDYEALTKGVSAPEQLVQSLSTITVANAVTPTTVYTYTDDWTINWTTGVITANPLGAMAAHPDIVVTYRFKVTAISTSAVSAVTGEQFYGYLAGTPSDLISLERDPNNNNKQFIRDSAGNPVYVGTEDSELVFDVGSGKISFQVTPDNTTTRNFYATYTMYKASPTDYEPRIVTSLAGAESWYGTASATNSLSLGLQIFFQNGGGVALAVQVDPAGATPTMLEWQEAIDKLKETDAYCIIPLLETNYNTNTWLPSYMKQHVEQMSSTVERRERITVLGGPTGADNKSDKDGSITNYLNLFTDSATRSARMAYLAPSSGKKTLTTQLTLAAPYLAAAVAGVICNPAYTSGEPISGKSLTGFDSVEDIYARAQKNQLAADGLMYLEQSGTAIKIRHALSTSNTDIVRAELKITRIKDSIARLMRTTLEGTFINTRNVGSVTLNSIKGYVILLLDGVASLRDIVAYENVQVTQNPTDPRQVDVSFQIRPSWDVSWILITFGVTI